MKTFALFVTIAAVGFTITITAVSFVGTPANAQERCDPRPKNPRQQCAKQVGGACMYRQEFRGYRWWALGAAQNRAFLDCLRKKGIS